jgi:hypothetical protein
MACLPCVRSAVPRRFRLQQPFPVPREYSRHPNQLVDPDPDASKGEFGGDLVQQWPTPPVGCRLDLVVSHADQEL